MLKALSVLTKGSFNFWHVDDDDGVDDEDGGDDDDGGVDSSFLKPITMLKNKLVVG